MYTVSKNRSKKLLRKVRCKVCRNEILHQPTIMKLGFKFETVCRECCSKFSKEDLGLMVNMFNAFGGYFGKFNSLKVSTSKIINAIFNDLKISKEKSGLHKLNVKFLHKALLHGIIPQQFLNNFKEVK